MWFKKSLTSYLQGQHYFARKSLVKTKVLGYYDSLYPDYSHNSNQYAGLPRLFRPPYGFAKIATWVLGLGFLSTGTFATVAPEAFSSTKSLVETKVDTVIEKTLQVSVDRSFKDDIVLSEDDEAIEHKNELKRLIREIKQSRGDIVDDKILDDIVEFRALKRALKDSKNYDYNDDDNDDDNDDEKEDKRRRRSDRREDRIEDILQGIKLRGDGSIDDSQDDEDDNMSDSSNDDDSENDDSIKLRGDGSIDDSQDDEDDDMSDSSNDDDSEDDDSIDDSQDDSDDRDDDSRRGRGGDRK